MNRRFPQALANLVDAGDHIWVHDYHLLPLAAELRALGVRNRIGYFHHIPWPSPEVSNTLPGASDLLHAMMEYDLIGMQTNRDADNLKRNLVQELGAPAFYALRGWDLSRPCATA